jgi:hypothetical protein
MIARKSRQISYPWNEDCGGDLRPRSPTQDDATEYRSLQLYEADHGGNRALFHCHQSNGYFHDLNARTASGDGKKRRTIASQARAAYGGIGNAITPPWSRSFILAFHGTPTLDPSATKGAAKPTISLRMFRDLK